MGAPARPRHTLGICECDSPSFNGSLPAPSLSLRRRPPATRHSGHPPAGSGGKYTRGRGTSALSPTCGWLIHLRHIWQHTRPQSQSYFCSPRLRSGSGSEHGRKHAAEAAANTLPAPTRPRFRTRRLHLSRCWHGAAAAASAASAAPPPPPPPLPCCCARLLRAPCAREGQAPGECAGKRPWRPALGRPPPRCRPCPPQTCGHPRCPPRACPLSAGCAPTSPARLRLRLLHDSQCCPTKPATPACVPGKCRLRSTGHTTAAVRPALTCVSGMADSLEQARLPPLAHRERPPSILSSLHARGVQMECLLGVSLCCVPCAFCRGCKGRTPRVVIAGGCPPSSHSKLCWIRERKSERRKREREKETGSWAVFRNKKVQTESTMRLSNSDSCLP